MSNLKAYRYRPYPIRSRWKSWPEQIHLDAWWGQFRQMCESKAGCAGSRVLFVSPKDTSQMCSGCRVIIKKELEDRWHECSCGCSLDRDHNAAINILRLGLQAIEREPALGRSAQRTRL
ncbi:MAG: zinc ribbon domain-containing protein [Ktedonobacteraceae bacterium]|jgi:transposase